MYEGAPDYPDKDIWWELVRALRRDDLLHRADGDPRLHEVGRRVPGASTTCPRCGCSGTVGEPINPKAWLWYHKVIGGERCPIVDTWWQTETGRDHDHARCPALTDDEAGLGRHAAAGHRGRGGRRGRRQRGRHGAGPARRSSARGRRCCARSTGGRPLRRDVLRSSARDDLPRRRRRARGTRTATSGSSGASTTCINVSGHRMSTAEVESAIVSHAKVAEAAVIGAGRRGHRPGDHARS